MMSLKYTVNKNKISHSIFWRHFYYGKKIYKKYFKNNIVINKKKTLY